jgi:hypothetical protein
LLPADTVPHVKTPLEPPPTEKLEMAEVPGVVSVTVTVAPVVEVVKPVEADEHMPIAVLRLPATVVVELPV